MATNRESKMSKDELLLEGDFEVFPNEKNQYKVELTRTGITYFPKNLPRTGKNVKYIHFGDVIGCRCRKSLEPKHENKAYITVFAYPLKKKLFSDKWIRHKSHFTLARNCDSTFDENRKVMEKWRRVIMHLCHQLPVKKKAKGRKDLPPATEEPINIDVDSCPLPSKTRLLVLVNPHSGPGKAMQIFQKQVSPMLDEADIQVKVIKTAYAGHATEMMKTLDRKAVYGIVIVSGDGLIYEVINGLMSREDWQDAMKIPVGCIPGGSGNALSCAINYSAGEAVDVEAVLHSTFILIKHRVLPMDLVLIQQPGAQLFSFLSVCWGLLADIDHESEKYRAIGEARFTLQAVRRIMGLRKYKGKLSFLPVSEYIPKSSNNNNSKTLGISTKPRRVSLQSFNDDDRSMDGIEGGFEERLRSKSVPNRLFRTESDASEVVNDDELTDIQASGDSTFERTHPMTNGNHPEWSVNTDEVADKEIRVPGHTKNNSIDSLQEVHRMMKVPGQPAPSNLLSPIDEPVPSDWITIEDEFVTVCAVYQTHLGSDVLFAPEARFSDGMIHLCFIRAGIQKTELIELMLMLEKGAHVDYPNPNFEMIKVLAFRLEPEGKEGVIMVDGEKVDYSSLQAQVLPGVANIMAIQ